MGKMKDAYIDILNNTPKCRRCGEFLIRKKEPIFSEAQLKELREGGLPVTSRYEWICPTQWKSGKDCKR